MWYPISIKVQHQGGRLRLTPPVRGSDKAVEDNKGMVKEPKTGCCQGQLNTPMREEGTWKTRTRSITVPEYHEPGRSTLRHSTLWRSETWTDGSPFKEPGTDSQNVSPNQTQEPPLSSSPFNLIFESLSLSLSLLQELSV